MEFERSTQARSWLFSEESLSHCREHRAKVEASSSFGQPKVRKFACGFDRRFRSNHGTVNKNEQSSVVPGHGTSIALF